MRRPQLRLGRAQPRRKVPGQMNKLEGRYSQQLDVQKGFGLIQCWWYERWTFKLADDTRFTPDFVVLAKDGVLEMHETKGFMRDDARVKLKLAAELFPLRVKLVKWVNKGWDIEDLTAHLEEAI
jgi:hypothetical protein